MYNLAINSVYKLSGFFASAYDDFGVVASDITYLQRLDNVEQVINRFFFGKASIENLERESIARSLNPGKDFPIRLEEEEILADDGFGVQLQTPSDLVEMAFRHYAQTELGAVALARLLEWDQQFINHGWREESGALTEAGISAYGDGLWRPFRVASNGDSPDTVTPSGALVLPDQFVQEYYSTGDISNPLAILHHEIKAHVLPLKEAKGLVPGREMELICIRLESEMLRELGLQERRLNWGKDDGTLDHTLHEASESYYHGLVRQDEAGVLVEVEPDTYNIVGPAIIKTTL